MFKDDWLLVVDGNTCVGELFKDDWLLVLSCDKGVGELAIANWLLDVDGNMVEGELVTANWLSVCSSKLEGNSLIVVCSDDCSSLVCLVSASGISTVVVVLADNISCDSALAGSVLCGREPPCVDDEDMNVDMSGTDAGLAAIPFLRSVAFLSGKQTGQSVRVQFFQCVIICRDEEQ